MYQRFRTAGLLIVRQLFVLITGIFLAGEVFAQTTTVKGRITDADTGEPVPYVSVVFKNTQIGTLSDSLGYYKLVSKNKIDSIRFSAVGYFSQTFAVLPLKTMELQVRLKSDLVKISQVNVRPDDGPVRRILRLMVEHKKQNNPDKYERESYRKYTKWEYHLMNVGKKMIQSKAFRNDQSLFKTDTDDSKYLPIYFSEQIVYNQFQRNPLRQKSTVLADKTSGVGILDSYQISGYTSALDIEVNFYNNFIELFSQNFVSPLNENGWFYYKYFLVDSTLMKDGSKQYRINFMPRRVGDKVFKGYLITENRKYSLVEIDGTLANTDYINFLKRMRLKSNYQLVNDSIPFYRRNQIDAVFNYVPLKNNPSKKPISLFFTQTALIDSVTVDQPGEVKLTPGNGRYETVQMPNATGQDNRYWDRNRLEPLNIREKDVAATIDSVTRVKAVKFLNNIARMSMTGYYDLGKFEFGPYADAINTNKVEGLHLFAGFRTSDEISTHYMVWGGVGYGFLNKKINGIAGYGFKFPTVHRQLVKLSYDDRYVRAGESEKILYLYENALSPTENNLISQVFKRDVLDELFRQQKLLASYEHEWHPGLLNKISASYTRHYSPPFYPFVRQGTPVPYVSAIDFNIDTRLSWKEKLIDDKFMRMYLSTDYPIIHISVGGGQVYYFGKQNYYGHIFTTVQQIVNLGQTYVKYAMEGGMYFGKLPYTMLDIPRGNETAGYFSFDFNMLNYMEYVHDKYLHGYFEYHLGGFFFNRLPLFKRLGLREVLSAKTMIGSFSNKNQDIVELPSSITPMKNPYLELGVGVENIVRLVRIEAVWRVTDPSVLGAPTFGIRAKFQVVL
jgi:hypothetical protein